MANWASTSYAIEGPMEALLKIEDAILHHETSEGASEGWEGDVLKTLGLTWESNKPDGTGKYMRGFIRSDVEPQYDPNTGALRFDAEEAWGVTDFNEVLEENFPSVKVFYSVEECGEEIYATNDREGKYFKDRFYADCCIDGNYQSDYFVYKSEMFKWLYKITDGKINTEEKVKQFNSSHEDACDDDENFINIHEFEVVD